MTPHAQRPWTFFLLALALATPAWVLGAMTGVQLLPGLPIAAVSVLAPVLAALILRWREGGTDARAFLARAVDFRRIPNGGWYAALLLIPLGIGAATFFALRLSGIPVPAPQISPATVLSLAALFLVAGTCATRSRPISPGCTARRSPSTGWRPSAPASTP